MHSYLKISQWALENLDSYDKEGLISELTNWLHGWITDWLTNDWLKTDWMTNGCLTQCLTGWLTINLPNSCTEALKVAPADWMKEVLAGYLPSASKANFTDSWPELETKRQLSSRLETPSPSWSSSQASPAKTIESFRFQGENDYKVRDFDMKQHWVCANQRHFGGKYVIPSSF